MPVAAQAEAGNIALAPGDWNEDFLAEIELFPIGFHDDQVDALSGAFEDIPKEQEMILWSM
jgi:predicted phage terminase large subunit-like protein